MRLASLLALLVLAHVAFGLLRVPHAVVARRVRDVQAVADEGYAPFAMQRARLLGADAIETLRAATPPDAVIAVRGDFKGALEFAPALLWPRLCRRAETLAGMATLSGRPIAAWTLVGDGPALRLEPR
jgi:hypothetical protein